MSKINPSIITPKKHRWGKRLLIATASLIILLVVAWFVVTSEAFFKGVILPQAGKAMHATLAAESASIQPFSQVTLRGLTVKTTGAEPLLTVKEIRARYSLKAILGGTLRVDEVLIDTPVLNVIQQKDGTSNVDALTQGDATPRPSTPGPAKSGPPPQVDLRRFHLKDATVRYTKEQADGTRDEVEIKGINVTLADVRNSAAGTLEFALEAAATLNPPDIARRGSAQLKHDGKYTFSLGADLFPTQITGSDRTEVTAATGALAVLAGLGADLNVEMTPTQIERIALTFRDRTNALGELLVSGPFDALKREGRLTVVQKGIDGRLLNRLGAASGLSFGSPAVTFTNAITLSAGGTSIHVLGRLAAANLSVSATGQPGPTLEAGANYNLTLNTKSDGSLHTAGALVLDPFISREGSNEFRLPGTAVRFEATRQADVIGLSEVRLALPPTARATNELILTGHVDLTAPEAVTGTLKLTSDALDLTDLYALLAGKPASGPGPAPGKPVPAPPDSGGGTNTFQLPVSNLVCEVKLGHVFLDEIDISDVQVKTILDSSRVAVEPLQCTLNGAPLHGSLDLNLGAPQFQYQFDLDAPDIPLAPLVNSLAPGSKGLLAGTATTVVHLKGSGATAADMQEHLSGQFDFAATNLNLALKNVTTPAIKSLINVIAAIPDAIRNPTGAVGDLLGGLLGANREKGGWAQELMQSPLSGIEAHGAVNNGTLELKQARLASMAFLAEISGTLQLATVPSNSIMHLPIRVSLSKSLADQASLTPWDTPTNAVYVALPDFVTMNGTLGAPRPT